MRGLLSIVVVVVVMGHGSVAKADAKSWFAYGINTSVGMRQNNDEVDGSAHTVMSTFGIQLKLLRFLGVELGYAPFGGGSREALRFDNPWNASALLYIVPTTPVGAYIKVGVGNSGLARIFDVRGSDASYHAGLGLELYATNHLVIGGEFLVLTPGVTPIVDSLVGENASPHDASYYVAPTNFRASIRASYFF